MQYVLTEEVMTYCETHPPMPEHRRLAGFRLNEGDDGHLTLLHRHKAKSCHRIDLIGQACSVRARHTLEHGGHCSTFRHRAQQQDWAAVNSPELAVARVFAMYQRWLG